MTGRSERRGWSLRCDRGNPPERIVNHWQAIHVFANTGSHNHNATKAMTLEESSPLLGEAHFLRVGEKEAQNHHRQLPLQLLGVQSGFQIIASQNGKESAFT